MAQLSGHSAVGLPLFDERFEHFERTSDGGALVVGSRADTVPTIFENDIWVAKLDSALNIVWEIQLATPADDIGWHAIELSGGGYVVAGVSQQSATNQMVLVRLTPAGAVVWARAYLGSPQTSDGVVVREIPGDRLALVGSEQLPVVGTQSALLNIVDAVNGSLISSSRFAVSPQGNLSIALAHFADALVVPSNPSLLLLAGRADFSASTPFFTNYSRPMAMLLQLPSLTVSWANAYGPAVASADEFVFGDATGMSVGTVPGSVFLNGRLSFFDSSSNAQGIFVSRIDGATGAESWMTLIDSLQAAAAAILPDTSDAVFVASRPFGDGQGSGVFGRVNAATGVVDTLREYRPEYPLVGSVNSALHTLTKFAFAPNPSLAYVLGGRLQRPVPGFFFINDGYTVFTDSTGGKPCFVEGLSLFEAPLAVPPRSLALQRVARDGSALWQPVRTLLQSSVLPLRCPGPAACNEADIAQTDGSAGPDGCVNNGDFQLFFASFFGAACGGPVPCNAADIAQTDGSPGADGNVDNGDFSLFFSAFFSAICPDCAG